MDKQPDSPPKKGTGQGQGDSGWQETAVILARISGIGWYVVGSIGAGIGAGWWLDRQFGTEPILLLIGLLLGVIAAFTGMIRLLSAFGRQRTRR
ncbi:MAG: AtpZ/AtpI family protein [Chloroflexi bacterium]|nr:AtpZ/AtpI family protein [Chloroflexota bacterium]